jgi:hypothetical protein
MIKFISVKDKKPDYYRRILIKTIKKEYHNIYFGHLHGDDVWTAHNFEWQPYSDIPDEMVTHWAYVNIDDADHLIKRLFGAGIEYKEIKKAFPEWRTEEAEESASSLNELKLIFIKKFKLDFKSVFDVDSEIKFKNRTIND